VAGDSLHCASQAPVQFLPGPRLGLSLLCLILVDIEVEAALKLIDQFSMLLHVALLLQH
jgi:hypothetical protein